MFSNEEKLKLLNELAFKNKNFDKLLNSSYTWAMPSEENLETYLVKKRITNKFLKVLYNTIDTSIYKVIVSSYILFNDQLFFKVTITVNETYAEVII
jgi:hypothetical protein